MNRSLIFAGLAALWLTAGAASCNPPPNPGPNPACLPAQKTLGDVEQALGFGDVAWGIGKTFISNPTIVLAVTTALDTAHTAVSSAQASIAAGNCDIAAYVKAAADAVQVALADIAAARTHAPASLAPSTGPDALGAMISAGNEKAEAAKAQAK